MSFAEQNPYQSFGYAPVAALAEEDARIAFIRRTYAHLGGAILAFVAIDAAIVAVLYQPAASDSLEDQPVARGIGQFAG